MKNPQTFVDKSARKKTFVTSEFKLTVIVETYIVRAGHGFSIKNMVLLLGGKSEIGAHVRCNVIWSD